MIEVRARRAFGATVIEADIATAADSLALVGPSGAGKTTLLNMVAGLETPDAGVIAIGGAVLFDSRRGVNVAPRMRRIGYVFQEPRLFPNYSVAGNLRYGASLAPPGAAPIGFEEVVGALGVDLLLDRRPGKLSGGEKQRVAIGRALLSRPRALLLDEPLSGLDPARREDLIGLIVALRDRFKLPMILVSHRLEDAQRLAEASAQVEPGRKVTLAE
ncbi:MAG TPA: ATP-binding cassette domain-containing protein [Roseiarcus sp.]|nr:ATP-binding cassette domain-containing protein [Roseiarcus sp.]